MRPFLTAEWKYLLMLNYVIDPALLLPFLPAGVELDTWNNKTYVSMVGFLFLSTKVRGLHFPCHANFEEVNLRFYVKRHAPDGWRRGVVFVKEIVPRQLIATVARTCYNEPYQALPMRHTVTLENGTLKPNTPVEYAWRHRNHWNTLRATPIGTPQLTSEGSEQEFITEHYWGYTAQPNGTTKEYSVEHPRWKTWQTKDAQFDCDIGSIYGPHFVGVLSTPPHSAFIAEGSSVTVGVGTHV